MFCQRCDGSGTGLAGLYEDAVSEQDVEPLRVGDRLEAKLTAENEFVAWTPVELVKVLKDYTVSFLKSDDIVANARRAEGIEWDVYGSELRRRGVQVTGAGIAKMNGWYGHAEAAQGPPKVWLDQCTVCNGKPLVCTKTGTCKHDPLHGKVDPAHKEKWHKPCPKGCQKTREVLQSQWQRNTGGKWFEKNDGCYICFSKAKKCWFMFDENQTLLYRIKSDATLPPVAGWTACDDGELPTPTLRMVELE